MNKLNGVKDCLDFLITNPNMVLIGEGKNSSIACWYDQGKFKYQNGSLKYWGEILEDLSILDEGEWEPRLQMETEEYRFTCGDMKKDVPFMFRWDTPEETRNATVKRELDKWVLNNAEFKAEKNKI